MRTLLLSLPVALLIGTLAGEVRAQYNCSDYHKYNCQRSGDKRWSVNGQSKSASVQVGRETDLNIIIHRGQDYRISICPDVKVLGEDVTFRLIEKVREPRDVEEVVTTLEPLLDANGRPTGATQEVRTRRTQRIFEEVEKVLWDNTEFDMTQEVEFSCASTKRIAIRIVAPGPAEVKPRRADKQVDIGCMGILIEHMATPGLGF